MKNQFALAASLSAALVCSSAAAASMQANISSLFQLSGKVYVSPTSVQWDGAASTCNPSTPMYMIDPSTAVGHAQLALVISAKELNHAVYLVGDGACVGGGPSGILAESLIGIQER